MDDQDRNATLRDLNELRAELRGEMSELRAELRGEMTELRAELRGEMSGLRTEMHGLADRLVEQLRDMQTEFLKTIYVAQQQADVQFRLLRAETSNADAAAAA